MSNLKPRILGSTALISLMIGAVAVAVQRSDAHPPGKEKADESAGPTVEQGNKNIKVLNGMPESQLIPAMKFISVSLGVSCNYCHVSKDGQLDTADDDKETKRMARAMIKMVQQANTTAFRGSPEVSCYTCHRGQAVPQRSPDFPVALKSTPPGSSGAAPSPSATPGWPSANEILNKYTDAIGGQTAIEKIKSAVIQGTVANASGSTGTFQADQAVPGKGYDIVTTQRGTRVRVLNEREGWEKTAFGVNALAGQQLEDAKLSFALFGNLKLKDQFTKFEVTGEEKIDDHRVYVLSATRADQKREHLYFDSETGLLLRRVTGMKTMIGVIPEETDFGDYRKFETVKLPATIRISAVDSQNPTSTRRIDKIEVDATIDDRRFNKPN